MNRAVIDTDILSEILKGRNEAVREQADRYVASFERLSVSSITAMEVVKGLHKMGREEPLRRFLASLGSIEVLSFDARAAAVAGRIYADLERTGQPIGRADPMIAATALSEGRVLVTGNAAHYGRIQKLGYDLLLENWRE